MKGTIPRGLFFYGGANQCLITLSLETAEMYALPLSLSTPLMLDPGVAEMLKAAKHYGRRHFGAECE